MHGFSVADQQDIAAVVNRYAWASDSRDFSALAACFCEDAKVTVDDRVKGRTEAVEGAQAIADWVEQRHRAEFAQGHRRRHMTMSFLLKSCNGVEAVAGAYFCVMVAVDGELQPTAFGYYDDRLRKVDGVWRIHHRHICIEGKGTLKNAR